MRDGPQIEAFLESNSQPQAHCAAVINAFLREGIEQLAEVLVTSDISDYRLKRCRVDPKVEVAEQREGRPPPLSASGENRGWLKTLLISAPICAVQRSPK